MISVPPGQLRQLDILVELKFYADRSSAIRAAIRDLLDLHREAGHFDTVEGDRCPQCGDVLAIDLGTGLKYCADCPWRERRT